MDEYKLNLVIDAVGNIPREFVLQIVDVDYEHWQNIGDSTRDEHMAFLDANTPSDIARWVRSVYADYCESNNNAKH